MLFGLFVLSVGVFLDMGACTAGNEVFSQFCYFSTTYIKVSEQEETGYSTCHLVIQLRDSLLLFSNVKFLMISLWIKIKVTRRILSKTKNRRRRKGSKSVDILTQTAINQDQTKALCLRAAKKCQGIDELVFVSSSEQEGLMVVRITLR